MLRRSFRWFVLLAFFTASISMKNTMAVDRRLESMAVTPAQTQETQSDDFGIVKRVVDSYRRTASTYQNLGESMWQLFFDTRLKPLHDVFLTGTIHEAANILRNPHNSDLFYGFDNLAISLKSSIASSSSRRDHAIDCMDGLMRLAEALGAITLDNPAGYDHIAPFLWHADAVIDKINQALGIQIVFPNPYPYEHGLLTSHGVMSYRAPQSLYQAYRVKQLLKGVKNPRVLEIGAGLGRTAYYARLFGIKDYTIVDLPFTAVSSGYFLGRTLGEEQVLLSGETAPDMQERVKILTPEEFLASSKTYDLILNADGFTEMDPKTAQAYWGCIEKATPMFLSINHEINPYTVKMLIDKSDRVTEASRYPYWMRRGYVEEVVRFVHKQP